jgi:hypothetical protein
VSTRIVVDRVVVETMKERTEATKLAPVLRAAFLKLAERLERSPLGRGGVDAQSALRRLEIDALTPEQLFGPAGAELIADELYQQLTRTRR